MQQNPIRGRRRVAGVVGASMLAIGLVIAVQGPASATSTTLNGVVDHDGTWTCHATTRSATKATIWFTPTDLITDQDLDHTLSLALSSNDSSCTSVSSTQTWLNSYVQKTLKSDANVGFQFRIKSGFYDQVDDTWSGTLSY
ncbi:hypothetical protein AB0M47_07600 [Hamadaea sp. NPDC051192]|uniref:hypothetical protein n=1 Tax=Hamadaea sp. NPDC051192 TaxID=3154940 RepID=UPI003438E348